MRHPLHSSCLCPRLFFVRKERFACKSTNLRKAIFPNYSLGIPARFMFQFSGVTKNIYKFDCVLVRCSEDDYTPKIKKSSQFISCLFKKCFKFSELPCVILNTVHNHK